MPALRVTRVRKLLLLTAIGVACASETPPAGPPASSTAFSPAPTVQDFHAEWCAAALPYTKLLDDLPALSRDARLVRGLDTAVDRLLALSVALLDEELEETATKVRVLPMLSPNRLMYLTTLEAISPPTLLPTAFMTKAGR